MRTPYWSPPNSVSHLAETQLFKTEGPRMPEGGGPRLRVSRMGGDDASGGFGPRAPSAGGPVQARTHGEATSSVRLDGEETQGCRPSRGGGHRLPAI